MSADYMLYALTEDELAEWDRLSALEGFVFAGSLDEEEEEVARVAELGQRLGTSADSDAQMDLIHRFHESGRAQFIGEVSWLKAGLLDDVPRYVPGPVAGVHAVLHRVGRRPIDRAVARAILAGMNRPNRSIYRKREWYFVPAGHPVTRAGWRYSRSSDSRWRGVAKPQLVKRWLAKNEGLYLATASE